MLVRMILKDLKMTMEGYKVSEYAIFRISDLYQKKIFKFTYPKII